MFAMLVRRKVVFAGKKWFLQEKSGFCRKKVVFAGKKWFLQEKSGFRFPQFTDLTNVPRETIKI